MSDHIPSIPFQFEHLPNELLFEIFDYVQLNDLIRAFYNLNHRLNSALYSSNIYLRILYPDDLERNDMNRKIVSDFFLNQRFISRLRLTHDKYMPGHQLLKLSYVRSLIIETPTLKLLQIISPAVFPRLEYLLIGYTSAKAPLGELHQDIFSNRFSFLRKCSLNNVNDIRKSWDGAPSIHSLGIWSDNPHTIIERVLSAARNLTTLHLFLTWPLTHGVLADRITAQHTSLKRFKLHLQGCWTLEKIDSLLAYVPAIENLTLQSSYFDHHMTQFWWNFRDLAYVFASRLPNLCYFDCELIVHNQNLADCKQISSFHTCFHRIKCESYSESDFFTRIFTNK